LADRQEDHFFPERGPWISSAKARITSANMSDGTRHKIKAKATRKPPTRTMPMLAILEQTSVDQLDSPDWGPAFERIFAGGGERQGNGKIILGDGLLR
jgi:hypothetical protein